MIYMDLLDPTTGTMKKGADGIIGSFNGVFQAGAFFGIIIVSGVMDRWGRKAGVIFCSFWSILGGAILCSSQHYGMFIAARFFAGMGSWGFLAVTPTYSAEMAPPKIRGLFVGLNGVMIALGYGLASYMGMAFFYAEDPAAKWRGPLGLALLFPIIMLVMMPFVPESPRFLLMKGRVEEAREIVLKLHRIPNDPDNEFARSEFYQMSHQAELDRTIKVTWWEMFAKPAYRKRTALAMTFAFIGQSTAVLVINNYGPTLYGRLGFDTEDQLRLQCGWITVGVIFNAVGAALLDNVGRRPLMIFGVAGCAVCLIIEAAMVAEYADEGTNKAGLGVAVAAFYLFLAVYSIGIDVAGVCFYSELFPNNMRSKGICLSMATIAITDLVYLQATSTAFANIGWKFYLVFIVISSIGAVWAWFMLPETNGIPLEEMAKLFGDDEHIAVYSTAIHLDHNTHDLVIDEKNGLHHVATEGGPKRVDPVHVEKV